MKATQDALESAQLEHVTAHKRLYKGCIFYFEEVSPANMNAIRDLIALATEAKRTLEIYEKLKEDAE